MKWCALPLYLLLIACATKDAAVPDNCLDANAVAQLLRKLELPRTWLHLDAAAVSSLTGVSAANGMTTIERIPATGSCRCCVTFIYDNRQRVQQLVIIRSGLTRASARQLARDVIKALDLPPADVAAPGDETALYRWNVPNRPGEQLALDITANEETAAGTTFKAALAVIGRTD